MSIAGYKYIKEITGWIAEQDEPELYWVELKLFLKRIYPDFATWLTEKKRQNRGEKAKVLEFNQRQQ
ncbi:MAG: hypothetical protein KAS28_04005 [Desulfobacula sp.]|nr:hypothetical protein [Desulfobacula sp.]